jgi:hypothetical protein
LVVHQRRALRAIKPVATTRSLHRFDPAATTRSLHRFDPAAATRSLHRFNPAAATRSLHRFNPAATTAAFPRSRRRRRCRARPRRRGAPARRPRRPLIVTRRHPPSPGVAGRQPLPTETLALPPPPTYPRRVTDIDADMTHQLRRASLGAVISLGVGAAIAASAGAYVTWLTRYMADSGAIAFANIYIMALGVVPLAVGLPLFIGGASRLRALYRVRTRPGDVIATELARRWGRPALKLCLVGGSEVAVITGELDRGAIADALRARAAAARLPSARAIR